ncbi:MAG: aminotransferase class V-fold PLP-dependent enzyme [Gemmatimonadota bacterium]
MSLDVDALRRREFPWTQPGDAVFLNAASTGPLPQRAVDVLTEWARLRATPHKLKDDFLFGTLARSRELIAKLIHARPDEIALAGNTGYGINLAARALPLAKGDVIVTPHREFPANVYPWMGAAKARDLRYRLVPAAVGERVEDVLIKSLDDRDVKCMAVSWVDFLTGYRVDLEELGRACRARGAYLVVDGIQGLGACALDLSHGLVDIFACGAQKWLLSPWGSGFVYVRRDLIASMEPSPVSWMAPKSTDDFRHLLDFDPTWRDDARRFEFVTLPFQDFAAMNASLDLFLELGPANVANHVASLATEIVRWGERRGGVEMITPVDAAQRAGIVSLRPSDGQKVSDALRVAGVTHSLREGAVRLSPHAYNTSGEVRRALDVLRGASAPQ